MTSTATERDELDPEQGLPSGGSSIVIPFRVGDKVYHITRSRGAGRAEVSLLVIRENQPLDITAWVHAALYRKYAEHAPRYGAHGGLVQKGTGEDPGWRLVYDLGRILWPVGFRCIGEGCQAPHHRMGAQSWAFDTSLVHSDGGYALVPAPL